MIMKDNDCCDCLRCDLTVCSRASWVS